MTDVLGLARFRLAGAIPVPAVAGKVAGMLAIFVAALGLGLVFNAAPGAVFAETVRQGVRGGFRPALLVQIGSLAGDALWAVLGLAGVGVLLRSEGLQLPLGLAGAGYLAYLAWDAWRASNQAIAAPGEGQVSARALRTGVFLSLSNPQNVAYWAALGSALGAVGVTDPSATDYVVFFAGFMTSSVAWSFFFAALVERVFRRAGAGWVRVTYRACAIALALLALSTLRGLVRGPVGIVNPNRPGMQSNQ